MHSEWNLICVLKAAKLSLKAFMFAHTCVGSRLNESHGFILIFHLTFDSCADLRRLCRLWPIFFLCLQFWATVSRPWLFLIFLCSSVPPISAVGAFARVDKNQSSWQWPPDQEVPLLYATATLPVPVASIPPGLAAISFSLYSESLTERSRLV